MIEAIAAILWGLSGVGAWWIRFKRGDIIYGSTTGIPIKHIGYTELYLYAAFGPLPWLGILMDWLEYLDRERYFGPENFDG